MVSAFSPRFSEWLVLGDKLVFRCYSDYHCSPWYCAISSAATFESVGRHLGVLISLSPTGIPTLLILRCSTRKMISEVRNLESSLAVRYSSLSEDQGESNHGASDSEKRPPGWNEVLRDSTTSTMPTTLFAFA